MEDITFRGISVSAWVYAPVIYFLWVVTLVILKKYLFLKLEKVSQKTSSPLDNIVLHSLDLPVMLLIFVSGAFILEKIAPVSPDAAHLRLFLVSFKAVAILAVVLFFDRLIKSLIARYSDRVEILKTSGGIAQGIARTVVLGLGILILLDSFGMSITPLIASLGIGSLAVALALQPTLENFFSGVQIVIDKPIRAGQFIKLDSGEEGYVTKIGWRSTWVRLLPNNMVVIPNKVLINSKIINYYYPAEEMSFLVQVGVHYESNLEKVEKVTIETASEVMKEVAGGVPEFTPFIRYHTFADSSVNFTVILRAKEFVDHYLLKHEFIKKLHARYAREGINIPYPIRAINYTQEKADGGK